MTQREYQTLKKDLEKQLMQEIETKLLRQFETRTRGESRKTARLYSQRVSALTTLTRKRRNS